MTETNAEPSTETADADAQPSSATFEFEGLHYLRAPVPVHFPSRVKVPEGRLEFDLRIALYQILKLAFGDRAAVGSDQFVYWDPTSPSECLAPDAFVRLNAPNHSFKTWKVWERGAPQVAVEIVSDRVETGAEWEGRLAKYRRMGVQELVWFDPREKEQPLRVWDVVENDLIERVLTQPSAASNYLEGHWVVVNDAEFGPMLRLSRDPEGRDLYPTPVEHEAEARAAAEERLRELEEELRGRG